MFFLRTLPLLLILCSLLYAHGCPHDQMNFTLKEVEDPHPSKFLKYSTLDYRNININFDYTNLGSSSFDTQILDIIGPPVKSLLEASIKVIPRTSRILVPPNMCDENIKIPKNASYYGDIVIFVRSIDSYSSFEARSWPCGYESKTHRPIVGAIEFNKRYMEEKPKNPAGYETLISITLHEIIHILGFSPIHFPHFINPNTLQPLTGHFFTKTVNGVDTTVLNLAPLTERLRAHFNCSTLEGAYLENEGGPGSSGSHFERRIFHNEVMTASNLLDARFSEFTLACCEGTGWYQVNYSFAEPMTYGKNQGCAFLDTKCINSTTLKPNFKEFCSPLTTKQVSWTRRGFGHCGASQTRIDFNLNPEFDYWGNQTKIQDSFSDHCPRVHAEVGIGVDCEDTSNRGEPAEFVGFGAKAFVGDLWYGGIHDLGSKGYCFKTRCEKKQDGNYVLRILMGSAESVVNCTAEGEINESSFGGLNFGSDWQGVLHGVLQCPDPNEFCNQVLTEGHCRGKCFGNGVCVEKQCQCNDGWTSYNCAQRKEVHQCSKCADDNLYTTCFGNSCICSASNMTCQALLGEIKETPTPYYKPEAIPYFVVDDDVGLARFLVPGFVILALVCLLGWKFAQKRKEAVAMEESLSHPILSKNPKESMTAL